MSRHFDLSNSDDEDDVMPAAGASDADGEASACAKMFPKYRWLLDWLPNVARVKSDDQTALLINEALRKVRFPLSSKWYM